MNSLVHVQLAREPIVPLTLRQMLAMGRGLLQGPDHTVASARFVQQELPKRLARRLLDLQLLPHLVVSNPHIRHVYGAYFQTLERLRALPEVRTLQDNERFTQLLRQLMDDNGTSTNEGCAMARQWHLLLLAPHELWYSCFLTLFVVNAPCCSPNAGLAGNRAAGSQVPAPCW